jgi:hypothetical protein
MQKVWGSISCAGMKASIKEQSVKLVIVDDCWVNSGVINCLPVNWRANVTRILLIAELSALQSRLNLICYRKWNQNYWGLLTKWHGDPWASLYASSPDINKSCLKLPGLFLRLQNCSGSIYFQRERIPVILHWEGPGFNTRQKYNAFLGGQLGPLQEFRKDVDTLERVQKTQKIWYQAWESTAMRKS